MGYHHHPRNTPLKFNSSPLKNGGTNGRQAFFYWVSVLFRGELLNLRVGKGLIRPYEGTPMVFISHDYIRPYFWGGTLGEVG